MIGQPEIRDIQLDDIYQKEGLLECLSEIAECKLNKKKLEELYFDREHMGIRTLVAVTGDFVLGTASILIEPKFIHNGGRVGHIEDVAVHPDFQGHGIGTQLMQELIDIARANNCYKLILDCSCGLIRFYERLGFRSKDLPDNMRLDLG